jgi:transposase
VRIRRASWHEQFTGDYSSRLVFVDESGANTQMTRWRGRAPTDQRLVARIPHRHYKTTTLIAAIRLEGPCAPWLFDGAMNGEMFLAWVEQGLVPSLRETDLVVMDNLATHKCRGVQQAIEAVGAQLLFLPPYSPDFNPIENMWSKIKQILRSAAPRTRLQLQAAAKVAFHAITATDCKGFFSHARYAT